MRRCFRRIPVDNRQRCDDINGKQINGNEMNVTQSSIDITEELELRARNTMSST